MDYFKDFVSSVSHIIMELSCEGGFDALCEEVTPDPEERKQSHDLLLL